MAEDTGLVTAAVSAGDDVLATQYNNLRTDILKMRQESMTAGETIDGTTTPKAVFSDEGDSGELKMSDPDTTTLLRFHGFAITDGTDGAACTMQHSGVVAGFSSLTPGDACYVQSDKTIANTETEIFVGIAVSATEVLIIKGRNLFAVGTISGSSTTDQTVDTTITIGFKPRLIIVNYEIQGHDLATQTARYYKESGIAHFIEATCVANWAIWGAYNTSENFTATANLGSALTMNIVKPNATGNPSVGTTGGTSGIITTISIENLTEVGFDFRADYTASHPYSTGRVFASWTAYG